MGGKPHIDIACCTQCRWLRRAAWMAQELPAAFDRENGEVALTVGPGAVSEVRPAGYLVWSRKAEGRFPDIKELKQRVRDRIAPGKALGHSDKQS